MSIISNPPFSVTLGTLSYANSNLVSYAGLIAATAATATVVGLTCAPLIATIVAVTAVAVLVIIAISYRHQLRFDFSLMYRVTVGNIWWSPISDDVIIGAIPDRRHIDELKSLGVTHVITLLDPFELKKGLLTPAKPKHWEAQGIMNFHVPTTDFEGVPPHLIHQIVQYMAEKRAQVLGATYNQNESDIDQVRGYMAHVRAERNGVKFYIHCKSGIGRSATIGVVDELLRLPPPHRRESRQICRRWRCGHEAETPRN